MVHYTDFGRSFGLLDYTFVGLTLGVTIGIGIYHGLRHRKNLTEIEYLLAGKELSVLPVALSIMGSIFSALALIGYSTEMYLYGSRFSFLVINYVSMAFIFNKFVLPILHPLEITSMYHYLEMRFNRSARIFASSILIQMVCIYLPLTLYMPSICFNQMTGFDIKTIYIVVTVIVVSYTSLGGYRATVWTDVFQTLVMFGSIILVVITGYVHKANEIGLSEIFNGAYETNHFEFPSFNPDPTIRISFWSLYLGGICFGANAFCNQFVVQRCLSLKTISMAKKASYIYGFLIFCLFTLGFFGGTILSSIFKDCNPKLAGVIKANDQMMPLLVILMTKYLPGISGIFIGGTFSASLSTFSSVLNSTAAVILEDFFKPFYRGSLSERSRVIILKIIVLVFGLMTIPLFSIIGQMNNIKQFAMSVESFAIGTNLGLFILGFFFPLIDGKCAVIGGTCSAVLVGWISWSANAAISAGKLSFMPKSLETSGCTNMFNVTVTPIVETDNMESDVMFLYRISYMYFPAIGVLATIICAHVAKLILGGNAPDAVDPSLIWRPSGKRQTMTTSLEKNQEESFDLLRSTLPKQDTTGCY